MSNSSLQKNIWKVVAWSVSGQFLADLLVWVYAFILDEKSIQRLILEGSLHAWNLLYYVLLAVAFTSYLTHAVRTSKRGPVMVVHYPAFACVCLVIMILLGTVLAFWYLPQIPKDSPLRRQYWEINLISGVLSVVYCYFIAEFAVRKWLYPLVLKSDQILNEPGIFEYPVHRRVLEFFVLTGVVPVLLIAYRVYEWFSGRGTGPLEIYFIAAVSVLMGIALTFVLSHSLVKPIQCLAQATAQVRAGDFTVQAPVHSKDEIGRLSDVFNKMTVGLKERDFIRDTLGRYVSPKIAQRLLSGEQKLGGEKRWATFLLMDIVGFTSLSEKLGAGEVVDLLNEIFSRSVQIIGQNNGICDKFIGDGLLAYFGLLEDDPFPEARAVDVAVKIQAGLAQTNERRKGQGQEQIQIGIGIHAGEVVAGNIGAQTRMQYTVIGDPVNVTSRIEHLTRELKVPILVSEAVAAKIGGKFRFRDLGEHKLRGKLHAVRLYAPNP